MLLNTPHSHHSKLRQKSCAAVQPDAQLVTMVIFNNATRSKSLLLVRNRLNEFQTLHTNEGRGKNGSAGFHKVLGSTKTPPPTHPDTHTHTQKTHRKTGAAPAADSSHEEVARKPAT